MMRVALASITVAMAFLAGCDETMSTVPSYSAPAAAPQIAGSPAQVNDAIASRLQSASLNGNVNIWSYFPDVVRDIEVLDAADRTCGGPGRAKPQTNPIFTVGSLNGRTLHTMTFICG